MGGIPPGYPNRTSAPSGEKALCFAPFVNVQATRFSTRLYFSPSDRIRELSPITPESSSWNSGSAALSTTASQVFLSIFGQCGIVGSRRVKPSKAL